MSKSKGKYVPAHTAPTQFGRGEFYGSGVRNPMGRVRDQPKPKIDKAKDYPKSIG